VYLAHDTVLDRPVAVKFIASLEPNSEARERFLVEARAAARVQHPNVLAIFRVGVLDTRPYLVTEYIRGQSLADLSMPVSWNQALDFGLDLARGLAAAHRQGVLHRDIKPGNAVVGAGGQVKLVDFGLAKLMDLNWRLLEPPRTKAPPSDVGGSLASGELGIVPVREVDRFAETQKLDDTQPEGQAALVALAKANGATRALGGRGQASPRPWVPTPTPITHEGVVMGTPQYMAPEIWRGEPASRRSDVYSLGALLYALCSGRPPIGDLPLDQMARLVQELDMPPLREVAKGVDPRFAAVVDRCLRFEPMDRFGSADELRDALEQLTPLARGAEIPEGNPYRGLLSFEAEHRALFFGRSGEIRTVLERLRYESFVLVAGESGVGKSSLCRAGILPLVADGVLDSSRTWKVVRFMPGRRPLSALMGALAPALGMDEEALVGRLRGEPGSLGRDLRRRQQAGAGLLIFVDQLEELCTLGDAASAQGVGEALAQLASGLPGVRVLATVRGDFLLRLASVPGLGDEVARALHLLRPMTVEGIREAIVGPARAKGVTFESESLVEELVTSTADGGLPLLQFALAELWEARDAQSGAITASALAAIGGVSGALARHADGVVAALPAPQREAARRILMQLVTLDGTRARRSEKELVEEDAARSALDALVRGRLLVVRDTEEGTSYEVAHEALLSGWATLRDWLGEHQDSRVVKQRLEIAAAEWARLGRAREALWSARQLGELKLVDPAELGVRDSAFVGASRRAVHRARNARRGVIASIPLAVALIIAGVQLNARWQLDRRIAVHVKEARTVLAEARAKNAEVEAMRKEAFAQFDRGDREKGEEVWASALALASATQQSHGKASQALETALMLDRTRGDVRGLLGDVLYERAILAERDRDPGQMEEFLRRLELYDEGGERRRAWSAPAKLAIDTTDVRAVVSLDQFRDDGDGNRQRVHLRDLGYTPVAEFELPAGSYLLMMTAPEYETVRYPLVLARNERMHLKVQLLREGLVPSGFVYVPSGRFLFGSADEALRSRFFNTAPLHSVDTGAYLIARTETTIGEWLQFLEALAPTERARRAPRIDANFYMGLIELSQLAQGGWQLIYQPVAKKYVVRSGERIQYALRSARREQDWGKLPLSGMSWEDAAAYMDWLRTTGRVPGARFCAEAEWERAARGADGREYPHGDHLDHDDANFDETYGKEALGFGADEVGSHPVSRSPFGLDDMSGNVWEWTKSSFSRDERVMRGGAYYFDRTTSRVTNREVAEPRMRSASLGFRVCADLPQTP
jgi:serine/threonine protein kinase/formylglycine-generating enzyme required for sulfatase activity